jgi:hypothetical protein
LVDRHCVTLDVPSGRHRSQLAATR